MAKQSFRKNEDINVTLKFLQENLPSMGITMELVDRSILHIDNTTIHLLVYEKYYYRSRNRTSLSVLVVGNNHEVHIDLISSGGGAGVFIRWSLGAENSFVNQVSSLLRRYGYSIIG